MAYQPAGEETTETNQLQETGNTNVVHDETDNISLLVPDKRHRITMCCNIRVNREKWLYRNRKKTLFGLGMAIIIALAVSLLVYNFRQNMERTIILISFDGFRWDYFKQYPTPNLDRIVESGFAAPLQPIFPSKTFPNHYTLVTGLYAESHGIVANSFFDPVFNETFKINNPSAVTNGKWWGGEPLWVTAELQGKKAATYFWPGSEAPIKGKFPSYYMAYDKSMPNKKRVEKVLSWLALPDSERPVVITLYFDLVDTMGHMYGPFSPQVEEAVLEADSLVKLLLDGIEGRNSWKENVNVAVVSDHGMASINTSRVILLDDYIDLSWAERIPDWTPVLAIWPKNESLCDVIYQQLSGVNHLKVYKKDTVNGIPLQYHYSNNRRIPDIVAVADDEWSIGTRDSLINNPSYYTGGAHGYNNTISDMRGIMIMGGSGFKQIGPITGPVENIHIYSLLCKLLNLNAAENNGTLSKVDFMLK